MSKISSHCQTCQLFHTPSHNTHTTLKACWEAFARSKSHNDFFSFFSLFLRCPFECQMDAIAVRKKKGTIVSICIHQHNGRILLFGLCQVRYHLAGWGCMKMAALRPAPSHFVFCRHYLLTQSHLFISFSTSVNVK